MSRVGYYCGHRQTFAYCFQTPTFLATIHLNPTWNGDPSRCLHRCSISIVSVTRDVAHVRCYIVHHCHHVPGHLIDFLTSEDLMCVNCYLTAKRESIDIECDSRKRRAHRNAEHSHRATLGLIFHYGEAISPPWPCWLDEWCEFPQNDKSHTWSN